MKMKSKARLTFTFNEVILFMRYQITQFDFFSPSFRLSLVTPVGTREGF